MFSFSGKSVNFKKYFCRFGEVCVFTREKKFRWISAKNFKNTTDANRLKNVFFYAEF